MATPTKTQKAARVGILAQAGGPATQQGHQRPPRTSLHSFRKHPGEVVVGWVLRAAAWLTILITLGIVLALVIPSIGFFREVSVIEFLFGTRWAPRFADASFGVIPLITACVSASRPAGPSFALPWICIRVLPWK